MSRGAATNSPLSESPQSEAAPALSDSGHEGDVSDADLLGDAVGPKGTSASSENLCERNAGGANSAPRAEANSDAALGQHCS